jgi:hypothetical protein
MALKRSKILLVLYLLLTVHSYGEGETVPERQFKEKEWKELIKDKNFEEDYIKPSQGIHPPNLKAKNKYVSKELQYVFWGIAILFLLIALYFIVKAIKQSKTNENKQEKIHFNEEHLDQLELFQIDSELEKYLKLENYRYAFRLRFLQVLKQLESKNLIQYKREKTNRLYLSELKNYPMLFQKFEILCLKFDPIWYGEKPMNNMVYMEMDQVFIQCINEVSQI